MFLSRTALGVALVLACAATAGPSAQPSSTTDAVPARVPFLRIVTAPGFRAPTFQKAVSGEAPLLKDQRFLPLSIEADASGPCFSQLSMPAHDASDPRASASWIVEASLVAVEGDEATIDLRWHRRVPRAGVLMEGDLARTERLVLRDGARGVIDVVHALPGVTEACSRFAVGLELDFRAPSTEVANAGFGYELWLVDRAASAPAATVVARATGRQGRSTEYAFPPIRLPGTTGAMSVHASGVITGEARRDGSIELNVDHWQGVQTERRGSGSGGRKRLTVRDGETVEFELPAEIRANLPEELRQHDFALRVTTERLW
jgi:hypothetical protein